MKNNQGVVPLLPRGCLLLGPFLGHPGKTPSPDGCNTITGKPRHPSGVPVKQAAAPVRACCARQFGRFGLEAPRQRNGCLAGSGLSHQLVRRGAKKRSGIPAKGRAPPPRQRHRRHVHVHLPSARTPSAGRWTRNPAR